MADLNDVFGFRPDRPTHPDMAALSNVVLRHDGNTEDADFSVEQHLAQIIDPDVLVYMAKQRVYRMVGGNVPDDLLAKLCTIFLDGFMIATRWSERDKT
jgi:hypothetical protein